MKGGDTVTIKIVENELFIHTLYRRCSIIFKEKKKYYKNQRFKKCEVEIEPNLSKKAN